MGESPRWHDGRLWVADWGAGEILAIDPDGATRGRRGRRPRRCRSASTGCRTGACSSSTGAVGASCAARPTASFATHADLTARRGAAVERHRRRRARQRLRRRDRLRRSPAASSRPGLIALVTPDGEARPVADGVAFPNGMAITPDGGDAHPARSPTARRLTAFDIARRRRPLGPARLGRPRRRRPRRHLRRRRGRGLVRRRAQPALRPRRARAARSSTGSTSTAAASRACSAAPTARRCSSSRASGAARRACGEERGTGQVLAVAAPAPHAGRP